MTSLTIRAATAGDAPAVLAIYAPIVEHTAISFEEVAPSLEEMQRRIAAASDTRAFLVAERGGAVAGYAYGSEHRSRAAYRTSADVTVYVADHARRSGVGLALYEALLAQLNARGFHAAFAGIALPNPGSVALHERVGFTPVGVYREVGFKFGEWRDVSWWQRLLG
ncbi:MAG: arsinothricin resistance N-acetyltransferase ArsN1 family B [Caulobacteraceae bacterium]